MGGERIRRGASSLVKSKGGELEWGVDLDRNEEKLMEGGRKGEEGNAGKDDLEGVKAEGKPTPSVHKHGKWETK